MVFFLFLFEFLRNILYIIVEGSYIYIFISMAIAKKTTPIFGYIVTPYVSVKMIANISSTLKRY